MMRRDTLHETAVWIRRYDARLTAWRSGHTYHARVFQRKGAETTLGTVGYGESALGLSHAIVLAQRDFAARVDRASAQPLPSDEHARLEELQAWLDAHGARLSLWWSHDTWSARVMPAGSGANPLKVAHGESADLTTAISDAQAEFVRLHPRGSPAG